MGRTLDELVKLMEWGHIVGSSGCVVKCGLDGVFCSGSSTWSCRFTNRHVGRLPFFSCSTCYVAQYYAVNYCKKWLPGF